MTSPPTPALPRLSRALAGAASGPTGGRPERVLQFGKGNFLRGFFDWMVERMNAQGLFGGDVVVVEATGQPQGDGLAAQQGLYTTVLRGRRDGEVVEERQLVGCVSRVLNPYRDDAWLATAALPEIRFVVSNTTEAGIALDPADALDARPSPSFPGKLTQWLHARWARFGGDPRRGVVVLPCELVEENGRLLRRLVLELAAAWRLPEGFSSWLSGSCRFTSTLVDRIVTGYPADAAELCAELGYDDRFLVVAEPYHAWVIEGPESLEAELPLRAAGLHVIWTDDVTPYRDQKVRILNGAHSAAAVLGTLAGRATVGECMRDPALRAYVEALLEREIEPTLALPAPETAAFTRAVLERFDNPYLEHRLASILLNSVSKFRARLLGPLAERIAATGAPPPRLALAFAALFVLYRPDPARPPAWQDDAEIFRTFARAWSTGAAGEGRRELVAVTASLLADRSLWGQDVAALHPGLVGQVADGVESLLEEGASAALASLGAA